MMQQRRPQHEIDFLEKVSPTEKENFFAEEEREQLKAQAKRMAGYSNCASYVSGSEYCILSRPIPKI